MSRPAGCPPLWPRWEVVEGQSRYTCYAPDAATAERGARKIGFPTGRAEMIETGVLA